MDDQLTAPSCPSRTFLCPGETHPIDRAIHLARLAAYYPACQQCPSRYDAGGLSSLQLHALAEIERRESDSWRWSEEGLEGTTRGDVRLETVAGFATALAMQLWSERPTARPVVLIGGDGAWSAADYLPAACRALHLAGCVAVEVGAVTSPCLAYAAGQEGAAAIWIGNASGQPHALAVRAILDDGCPASSPGGIDAIRQHFESNRHRRKRSGGELRRSHSAGAYLRGLAEVFHGLRPLRIALDTTCEVFVRYWQQLSAASACRVLRIDAARFPVRRDSFLEERLSAVAREVISEGAHLGIWIDGLGEHCHLVDERGEPVACERVFRMLERFFKSLDADAVCLRMATGTRQRMAEHMSRQCAVFGSDGDRYWLAGQSPVPDALAVLCLLVKLLSRSDRPLSEVLDAAFAAE